MYAFCVQLQDVFIIHSFMRLSSTGGFLYGCMGLLLLLFKAFVLYGSCGRLNFCLSLE